MEGDREAIAMLRALAAATRRLESLTTTAGLDRYQHLTIRETTQGLWIAVADVRRRPDGPTVERTLSARNALDGGGWQVERDVLVNASSTGEPEVLASLELPVVRLATTAELAAALSDLLDEVLAAPTPIPSE